jgi:hypothetical protein
MFMVVASCKDLEELNEDPNGVTPNSAHPNLVLGTVLTEAAKETTSLGFGNIAGVMQHTQKDAWFSGHNDYDWSNQSWSSYYGILRNNKFVYDRATELGLEFHQGVSKVMSAYVFGMIADIWGDAPYTNALNGDQGGEENIQPVYDNQGDIYKGIIAELEEANTLLSKNKADYDQIFESADVIFGGDPAAWRKFANSLALRYYMRLSAKEPAFAKAGIEKIVGNASQYPIITSSADDATMSYAGNGTGDSWPGNTVYDGTNGSNYRRVKMCATLVNKMQSLNDPRLNLWAKKVEIPIVVDASFESGRDEIVDGVRYLHPDAVPEGMEYDEDPDYVGIPPSWSEIPSSYNINPTPGQLSFNPHVSYLNDMYTNASGNLLLARLLSAAEVHFILAEAALTGVANTGDAQTHYEAGVRASMEAWGVDDMYDTYIAETGVAYDGTHEQIMEQKWIASWTSAAEAWFDFRRTGLPALNAGPSANRQALPIRFYYMTKELELNPTNANIAVEKLETTAYTQADGKNSAWAKPWVAQGTGKPW